MNKATIIPPNTRTRADHAEIVTGLWRESLDGIHRTGLALQTAKAELPHGEWTGMCDEDLPFRRRAAQMLMAIAKSGLLSNAHHAAHLPVSWTSLYLLARLDDDERDQALADGRIHAQMTRSDALRLVKGDPEPTSDAESDDEDEPTVKPRRSKQTPDDDDDHEPQNADDEPEADAPPVAVHRPEAPTLRDWLVQANDDLANLLFPAPGQAVAKAESERFFKSIRSVIDSLERQVMQGRLDDE